MYSAAKLLAGENALIATQDKHTGPVRALDFNPFQTNLLASGASESDILIWDLNNTTTPMTPGTKTQPLEDIQNVAWNRQVQHILASVFSSRCIVWDLRKNEPIIKLSDSQSRVRFSAIQWHPEIATQLWLASEDDQSPVVQLWDLRYATAPAKTLNVHQRGILGLTWCPKDTDLMVSCGKDNKILCWNPNVDPQVSLSVALSSIDICSTAAFRIHRLMTPSLKWPPQCTGIRMFRGVRAILHLSLAPAWRATCPFIRCMAELSNKCKPPIKLPIHSPAWTHLLKRRCHRAPLRLSIAI